MTLDYEDYLWNTPYARCVPKGDTQAIEWLRTSYLDSASAYIDIGREIAKRCTAGRSATCCCCTWASSAARSCRTCSICCRKKGFTLVTLEEAQRDTAYEVDPDTAFGYGGTLLEQLMEARKHKYATPWPKKPREKLTSICSQ